MREYLAIADRIAGSRPGRVLDWGCGHGQVSHLLRERGIETVAYDYRAGSPPTLVRLEQFPEIEAHVGGDPVLLPFEDDEFDTVLSCGVLEHVARPADSLRELQRVLRPGGRLLIYKLPNRLSYLERVARHLGMYYHGALPDDRVYGRRSAVSLLSANGFRVVDFRRTNMLPLTIEHPLAQRYSAFIWKLNVVLARIPGLSLFATNVELEATSR
jgi:ubiquinone/menaquinone biosynthesis C-methylase UbiE